MPPYGRGGAGNFQALEKENARIAEDPEANQSAADSQTAPTTNDILQREQQQYAHLGRGGAGNYYSPKEVHQDGMNSSLQPTVEKSSEPKPAHGRGGAGNYAFGLSEIGETAAQKEAAENEARENLRQDIEKGVKEQLAFPQKAKLSDGEPV